MALDFIPTYFFINENGELIDTPKSGLFGVERELSGYLGLRLAFNKFNNSNYFEITQRQS